jgi:hypothetical protein
VLLERLRYLILCFIETSTIKDTYTEYLAPAKHLYCGPTPGNTKCFSEQLGNVRTCGAVYFLCFSFGSPKVSTDARSYSYMTLHHTQHCASRWKESEICPLQLSGCRSLYNQRTTVPIHIFGRWAQIERPTCGMVLIKLQGSHMLRLCDRAMRVVMPQGHFPESSLQEHRCHHSGLCHRTLPGTRAAGLQCTPDATSAPLHGLN